MNQLEHLKALRDKARIQTEQAKAVLRQQGEISDSLDKLIAALEGKDETELGSIEKINIAVPPSPEAPAPPPPEGDGVVKSLGQLISNLEDKPTPGHDNLGVCISGGLSEDSEDGSGEVVWVEDEAVSSQLENAPPIQKKIVKTPPKLEPIVWEVADTDAAPGDEIEETPDPASTEADEDLGSKFKFFKFGEKSEGAPAPPQQVAPPPVSPPLVSAAGESADTFAGYDDDTRAINTSDLAGAVAAGTGAAAVAVKVNEDAPAPPPAPAPAPVTPPTPAAPPPAPIPVPPSAVPTAEGSDAEDSEPAAIATNIFFDANSAYLKDSELAKLRNIAEVVANSESRLVKIQGLEDLASSNDFKELLASRRILAVKKKLAEQGLVEDQMTVNEIELSDEGRVLSPPSLSIVPA